MCRIKWNHGKLSQWCRKGHKVLQMSRVKQDVSKEWYRMRWNAQQIPHARPGYRTRKDADDAYQSLTTSNEAPYLSHAPSSFPNIQRIHITAHFPPLSLLPSSPAGLSQYCPSLLSFLDFLALNQPFLVGALSNLSAGPIL